MGAIKLTLLPNMRDRVRLRIADMALIGGDLDLWKIKLNEGSPTQFFSFSTLGLIQYFITLKK